MLPEQFEVQYHLTPLRVGSHALCFIGVSDIHESMKHIYEPCPELSPVTHCFKCGGDKPHSQALPAKEGESLGMRLVVILIEKFPFISATCRVTIQ